jgi:hypothetical protein
MDFDQTWYILSPYENLEPYWFSRSYVKDQGHRLNFYRITSLWTLESTSFNGFLTKLDTYLVLKIPKPILTRSKLNKGKAWRIPLPKNFTRWPWPWKSIGFQILLRTKYVPSLVKIHWMMLILECWHGCYMVKFWPGYLDLWPIRLWPWKSIRFRYLKD